MTEAFDTEALAPPYGKSEKTVLNTTQEFSCGPDAGRCSAVRAEAKARGLSRHGHVLHVPGVSEFGL